MTKQTQESLGLEVYKDILDSYTIMEASQVLGLSEQDFIAMLSSDRVTELDEMVLKSFKNYWDQSSESDKKAFIDDNLEFLEDWLKKGPFEVPSSYQLQRGTI